jgi:hypothetical protein
MPAWGWRDLREGRQIMSRKLTEDDLLERNCCRATTAAHQVPSEKIAGLHL